jgi:hypothetical protein
MFHGAHVKRYQSRSKRTELATDEMQPILFFAAAVILNIQRSARSCDKNSLFQTYDSTINSDGNVTSWIPCMARV